VAARGCQGLEIAASKIWPEPTLSSMDERRRFRKDAAAAGLGIISLHSLLYTRRDLGLFRDSETERATARYLIELVDLASDLGAPVLVFGSPAARTRGPLAQSEAYARAADFFAKPAAAARERGVSIVIEPLSPKETDFVNTAEEGLRLVEMVASPGFGLHLDAKSVAAEGPESGAVLSRMVPHLQHFHINDPGLDEVGGRGDYHAEFGRALNAAGYDKYASIEMRTLPDFRSAIASSVEFAKKNYIVPGQE
ncbi:MAG TPA: sugar phosphate isomerase/epimerase family protein, partial [Fimbriimonadaceae bacterium]|nr:sugar phosphate isomerase/epimerase family protein [Fimbriimonadaceae bacterium]